MVEEWRPIPGHDRYEVSNLGRVRALHRPRILTPSSDDLGRKVVNLWRNDERWRLRRVHQLVAEAFLGPRPEGMVTCHNDGDNTNNRADNLRYDSVLGNVHDKYKHGTHQMGSRNPCAALTEDRVREIRERFIRQHSQTRFKSWKSNASELASEFGTTENNILQIARRKTWAHV